MATILFHPATYRDAPVRDKTSVFLHPTISHVRGGYRPMVTIQDARTGQQLGSKVERGAVYQDAAQARAWARVAASKIATEFDFVKVVR